MPSNAELETTSSYGDQGTHMSTSEDCDDVIIIEDPCKTPTSVFSPFRQVTTVESSQTTVHRCPICDKEFRQPEVLDFHMHLHGGINLVKALPLDAYGKALQEKLHSQSTMKWKTAFDGNDSTKASLGHGKTHSKRRCGYCYKRFDSSEELASHKQTHEDKLYECNICTKRFTVKDKMMLHKKLHSKTTSPGDSISGARETEIKNSSIHRDEKGLSESKGSKTSRKDKDRKGASKEKDSEKCSSKRDKDSTSSSSKRYKARTSSSKRDKDIIRIIKRDKDSTGSSQRDKDGTSSSSGKRDSDITSSSKRDNDRESPRSSKSDKDITSSSKRDKDSNSSSKRDKDSTSSSKRDKDSTSSSKRDSDRESPRSSKSDKDIISSSKRGTDITSSSKRDKESPRSSKRDKDKESPCSSKRDIDKDSTSSSKRDRDSSSSSKRDKDKESPRSNQQDVDKDSHSISKRDKDSSSSSNREKDKDSPCSSKRDIDKDSTSSSKRDRDSTSSNSSKSQNKDTVRKRDGKSEKRDEYHKHKKKAEKSEKDGKKRRSSTVEKDIVICDTRGDGERAETYESSSSVNYLKSSSVKDKDKYRDVNQSCSDKEINIGEAMSKSILDKNKYKDKEETMTKLSTDRDEKEGGVVTTSNPDKDPKKDGHVDSSELPTSHNTSKLYSCPRCRQHFKRKEKMKDHLATVCAGSESSIENHEKLQISTKSLFRYTPRKDSNRMKTLNCDTSSTEKVTSQDLNSKESHCQDFKDISSKPVETSPKRDKCEPKQSSVSKNTCSLYGKRFKDELNVRKHMKNVHSTSTSDMHSSKKPYKCEICGKGFSQKENVGRHKRSFHLGLRPYKCTACKKTFTQKWNMSKHRCTPKENIPGACEATSPNADTSRSEVYNSPISSPGRKDIMTSTRIKLTLKRSSSREDVTHTHKHRKIHSSTAHSQTSSLKVKLFTCTLCGHTYRSAESLESHMEEHSQGKKASELCHNVSPKQNNQRTVLGNIEAPVCPEDWMYNCPSCKVEIEGSLNLILHIKAHLIEWKW